MLDETQTLNIHPASSYYMTSHRSLDGMYIICLSWGKGKLFDENPEKH